MKCPRCDHDLQKVTAGGVEVDVCQDGCGGIWFDLFELDKMDQPDESAGWLLDNLRIDLDRKIAVDLTRPVDCPRCDGVPLMRQRHEPDSSIMIDKCRVCGGVWLDFGELFAIRSGNAPTPATRTQSGTLLGGLRQGGGE